jgi:hypothetical protein
MDEISQHICPKCGRDYKTHRNLFKHMHYRKTQCVGPNVTLKVEASEQNKEISDDLNEFKGEITQLKSEMIRLSCRLGPEVDLHKNEIAQLKAEIALLRAEIARLQLMPSTTNNQVSINLSNVVTTNNITNITQINLIEEADISGLSIPRGCNSAGELFNKFANDIYMNPTKPENHSIHVASLSPLEMYVKTKDGRRLIAASRVGGVIQKIIHATEIKGKQIITGPQSPITDPDEIMFCDALTHKDRDVLEKFYYGEITYPSNDDILAEFNKHKSITANLLSCPAEA